MSLFRSSLHSPAHLPFVLGRLPCLVALAWGGVLPLHALAEDAAPASSAATGSLKAVVVSGSRSERAVEDVPATLDVFSGEALNPAAVQDIRDLARDLPNVSVARQPARFGAAGTPVGREGNAGFNIRGLEGNRVLLLVDGIRVPQGLTNGVLGGAAFGRDYYDMGLISRVEIVRGANSALYGSDGVAGSVAMFTTEPQDLLKPGQTLGGKVVTSYASENAGRTLGLTLAGVASDTVQWLGSVQTTRANELANKGENNALNTNRTTPNPQSDEQQAFLGKLVITPGGGQKHTVTLEQVTKKSAVEVYSGRAVTASAATSVIDLDATTDAQRTRLSWDARYKLTSPWADELRTTLGVQSSETREVALEDRNTSADRVRDTTYAERMLQATVQAEKTLPMGGAWSQKLIYGLDLTRANMTNLVTGVTPPSGETFPLKRFPDTVNDTHALFVQTEMSDGVWSVIPALRYDQVSIDARKDALYTNTAASLTASAFSPKLGVIYRATPQSSVYGNLASGFKAPTPIQLNNFFENTSQFYKTIANPNLKPETSVTFELGTRNQLGSLELEAAAFAGRYKDFIEETVQVGGAGVAGNPTIFQSVNLTAVSLSGFEVKGGYRLSPDTRLRFAYGQTRGTDTSTGRALNSVNPAKTVLGVDHQIGAWKLGATLSHVMAKDAADINNTLTGGLVQFATPAYTTLDLKASWTVRPGVVLSAGLNNVTDQKYWEWTNVRGIASNAVALDAFTAPGRNASLALVASF